MGYGYPKRGPFSRTLNLGYIAKPGPAPWEFSPALGYAGPSAVDTDPIFHRSDRP